MWRFRKIFFLMGISISLSFSAQAEADTTRAQQYFDLGEEYLFQYQFDSARHYFKASSEIYRSLEDWEGHIKCLNKLSESYWRNYELEEAEMFTDSALHASLRRFGKLHPETATAYYNLAAIESIYGDYSKSLQYLNLCLSIDLKIYFEIHSYIASDYESIAIAYDDLDETNLALKYALKCKRIRESVFQSNNYKLASTYSNLSIYFKKIREFEKALNLNEKANKIARSLYDRKHPRYINTFINSASLHFDAGNYIDAIKTLDSISYAEDLDNIKREKEIYYVLMGKINHYQKKDSIAIEYFNNAKKIILDNQKSYDQLSFINNWLAKIYLTKNKKKLLSSDKSCHELL
ncbi:MAG TPA: hypothetical protein DDY13_15930 [Cytophagales bacterium]|jgi:tetratricopeptide (TPR) repeat protein|nr:hypothetical protein [Cytophagales bacterium]